MRKQSVFNAVVAALLALLLTLAVLGWMALRSQDDVVGHGQILGDIKVSTIQSTGVIAAQNDLRVDDTFAIDDTILTITGTQTYTPTASYYALNPTSTLTLTLGTGDNDGDFLWLINVSAQSVVVVDTGATAGGGNRTLGQNDVIGFVWDNTKWIEAFYSDNS